MLEYATQDKRAGYAGLFRLSAAGSGSRGTNAAADEYVFCPRGLDHSRGYQVTLDNGGITIEREGADLMFGGIPVRLDQSNTSELLLYRAIEC